MLAAQDRECFPGCLGVGVLRASGTPLSVLSCAVRQQQPTLYLRSTLHTTCRVAALLAAKHAIEHEGRRAVAIVAGDTVASARLQEFLARADSSCRAAANSSSSSGDQVPSPVIPNLYDRVARWHMQQYGTTREQLVGFPAGMDRPPLCAKHMLVSVGNQLLTHRGMTTLLTVSSSCVC